MSNSFEIGNLTNKYEECDSQLKKRKLVHLVQIDLTY